MKRNNLKQLIKSIFCVLILKTAFSLQNDATNQNTPVQVVPRLLYTANEEIPDGFWLEIKLKDVLLKIFLIRNIESFPYTTQYDNCTQCKQILRHKYQGTVTGHTSSRVVISAYRGLKGIIQFSDNYLFIEPAEQVEDAGIFQPLRFYAEQNHTVTDLQSNPSLYSHLRFDDPVDTLFSEDEFFPAKRRNRSKKRRIRSATDYLYLHVYFVNDLSMYTFYGKDVHKVGSF